jgi:hypothetical protein
MTQMRVRIGAGLVLLVALGLGTGRAGAQEAGELPTPEAVERDPVWWLTADGSLTIPLSNPYRDAFNVGVAGNVGGYISFWRALHFGVRIGGGGLFPDEADDRIGFGLLMGAVRLHPMPQDARFAGLWIEAAAGGAVLDGRARGAFEAAVGYHFETEGLALGPVVRFTHIVENADRFDGNDLAMIHVGLELVLGPPLR